MYRILVNFFFSLSLIICLMLLFVWNQSLIGFHLLSNVFRLDWLNISYVLAVDGISIFFVLLSVFLLLMCLLMYWYLSYKLNMYALVLFFTLIVLLNIFLTTDIFIFFVFFECIVIPMYILIGVWGSRDRKIYASYLLFIYTLLGSLLTLLAFLFLYFNKGSANYLYYLQFIFDIENQWILFLLIFLGFSVKVPIIPLHIWLPEAHVEAPTPGSVLLAGIILKLSFYAYFRFLVFTFSSLVFLVFSIAVLGLYVSSFAALSQVDIKKVIAYSSVSHMNFALIGLFCKNLIGILGSFFLMFGHALVSSALFICVGILYERYKTRLLFYYGGLVLIMPLWSTIFLIFILGNIGLPGTVNFVGEFLIILGSFVVNNFIIFMCLLGLLFTLIYSLFLYTRLANGPLRIDFIRYFSDITRREFFIFLFFLILVIVLGVYPKLIFDYSFASLIKWYIFKL